MAKHSQNDQDSRRSSQSSQDSQKAQRASVGDQIVDTLLHGPFARTVTLTACASERGMYSPSATSSLIIGQGLQRSADAIYRGAVNATERSRVPTASNSSSYRDSAAS